MTDLFTVTIEPKTDGTAPTVVADLSHVLREGEVGRVWTDGAFGPNGREYSRYVKDRSFQSRYHRGRHATVQDVAENYARQAAQIFALGLQRVANGEGREQMVNYYQQMIDMLYKRTRLYPPEREGSRYVRTMTLRNSWERTVVRK